MDINRPLYRTLLLRCNDIQYAPAVVADVVEDTVIDLLAIGANPREWAHTTIPYDYLKERLFKEDGEIAGRACTQEFWEFVRDPAGGLMIYQEQVAGYLHNFVQENGTLIYTLHENLDVWNIEVIRAFRNQWLFAVTGVNKCQQEVMSSPHPVSRTLATTS